MLPIINYHAVVETNFAPGTETATVDLVADPGLTVKLSIIDPEGKPVSGTVATGAVGPWAWQVSDQATHEVDVKSLTVEEPRRVTVRHNDRKLVGSVVLKGDQPGPFTLKLQPWAELKGRVIDEEGRPRNKIGLGQVSEQAKRPMEESDILPGSNFGGGIAVDKDGRFHVVGLVPGVSYSSNAIERVNLYTGSLFQDIKLAPGEVKDLGDLKVIKFKEGEEQ
jgi:hypothetical protein